MPNGHDAMLEAARRSPHEHPIGVRQPWRLADHESFNTWRLLGSHRIAGTSQPLVASIPQRLHLLASLDAAWAVSRRRPQACALTAHPSEIERWHDSRLGCGRTP